MSEGYSIELPEPLDDTDEGYGTAEELQTADKAKIPFEIPTTRVTEIVKAAQKRLKEDIEKADQAINGFRDSDDLDDDPDDQTYLNPGDIFDTHEDDENDPFEGASQ